MHDLPMRRLVILALHVEESPEALALGAASVAAAVILYEAFRQRMGKGMYDSAVLTPEEIAAKYESWIAK